MQGTHWELITSMPRWEVSTVLSVLDCQSLDSLNQEERTSMGQLVLRKSFYFNGLSLLTVDSLSDVI
jgi:hypothetical protein